MENVTTIFILAIIGAVLSILVIIFSSRFRHRGKSSRDSTDGGFWYGIFGDSGSSDSGSHPPSHHGHHHHDAGGSHHHGGFDGGGHHGGGFDGGGGHH